MRMTMRKLLLGTAGLMLVLALAMRVRAQSSIDIYNNAGAWSGAAEVCHIIQQAANNPTAQIYGVHVTNTSGATVYAAIFPNSNSQPTNGTVIPGGGWQVLATSDRDIDSVIYGIPASGGFEVCLSTTQGTFTAATAVGYFWALYKGVPAPTPT